MPLPALAIAALPWIASAVGTMLPSVVEAFRSGKTPEEAQKIIAPKRQEIVARLVGTGMNQSAAETMADESLRGEFAQAQLPEPMNPWLSGALSIGGAIGGYKLGKMGAKKFGPGAQDVKSATVPERSGDTAKDKAAEMDVAASLKRLEAPKEPASTRNVEATVERGPFPSPPMDRRYAMEWIREAELAPPGIARGRGFTMRDAPPGPFQNIGIGYAG